MLKSLLLHEPNTCFEGPPTYVFYLQLGNLGNTKMKNIHLQYVFVFNLVIHSAKLVKKKKSAYVFVLN
jgi:hypothetical protein